jgi:MFS family permease
MSEVQTREKTTNMRKVALTSLAGTSIEWYDFFLYGTAAAIIFPLAFFPQDLPPMVLLIISFSTFAVGFIARPLGGIVFGHFGDRVGRKRTLVVALMMMGVATTLIGLLPTYDSIGLAAPLCLVLLRFIQGLAVGGQWGGAMLLVTESAPADKRGWYGAYAQAGAPMGVILANLAFISVSASMSDEAFLAWGWRLPFIASILLIAISLYIQLRMEDTEAFKALQAEQAASPQQAVAERSPVFEAMRRYPRRILLAAGAFLSVQVTFYILIAFVIAYGLNSPTVDLTRDELLVSVLVAAAIMMPAQFYFSGLSDRVGRKANLPMGRHSNGNLGLRYFPAGRHRHAHYDYARGHHGDGFTGDAVWSAGRLFYGAVCHRGALFRGFSGLSNWRYPRRGTRAHHRRAPVAGAGHHLCVGLHISGGVIDPVVPVSARRDGR